MSRLVIASNRVADLDKNAQSGGLAVALGDALRSVGGVWFGWDGAVEQDGAALDIKIAHHDNVTVATIPMTESDYQEYYLGFANKVLWPVCHYRLDLCNFQTSYFEGYKRVNARFAETMASLLNPTDLVWAHDYHLISLASELRRHGVNNRLGFFLHIPFPPPEMLHAIPVYDWLVEALFQFDVVGFQTTTDLNNFKRFVTEEAGGEVWDDGGVKAFGRTIIANAYPIGIDVEAFAESARTPAANAHIARLNRRTLAQSHIIGVDRLDYTKGLPDRFNAYHRLLDEHTEHHKKVTLMQIAPPTRSDVEAYANIKQELEALSGAINGEFGDFDWTPVRYIHRNIPRETLAALFRGCRVGLVTPLRDGMNLVAKEYVAAQDADDPGVLILSRFAGAAEYMQESLIVNPYDIDDMASAMQAALIMPLEERQERHAALYAGIVQNDVRRWRETFLVALAFRPQEVAA